MYVCVAYCVSVLAFRSTSIIALETVLMSICTNTCIYTHTHTFTFMYIYIYKYVYLHEYLYIYIFIYIYIYIHIYIYAYMYMAHSVIALKSSPTIALEPVPTIAAEAVRTIALESVLTIALEPVLTITLEPVPRNLENFFILYRGNDPVNVTCIHFFFYMYKLGWHFRRTSCDT